MVKPSLHYLLMANQAMLQKRLFAGLKDTALTMGQPKILDYLGEHDGSNQKEIAAGCHIEAPSLTSLLNRMEEAGLIRRKNLDGNRRSLHVFLTETGRAYQERIARQFAALEREAMAGMTGEEEALLMNALLRISENLKSEGGDQSWKN